MFTIRPAAEAPGFIHGEEAADFLSVDISVILWYNFPGNEVRKWSIRTSFACTQPRNRNSRYSGLLAVAGSIYRNCIYCHIKILTILVPHCIISMR